MRSTPQRIADVSLIALFVFAISLPVLKMFVSSDESEVIAIEQRRMAPFPELEYRRVGSILWAKKRSLQDFPRAFEAWYDDHVGFRFSLIRCYNMAKVVGLTVENSLKTGEAAQGNVIVGRDGWLYLGGSSNIRDFRRSDCYTPADLAAWHAALAQRRDWLAARGSGYAFLVAPNKATIYPEFMPRSMSKTDLPSRLEQLLAEVS
ncbi:MAG: hypothetical protein K8U03_10830 [Planctomycetia bacterium]|nr:hypothetical protein [Planctomycetia bacterium]